jgi:uncharacterized protein YkwD
MRVSKFITFSILVIIEAFALIHPVNSAGSVYSQAIPVSTIVTRYGSMDGDPISLKVLDQTGQDDDRDSYVGFSGSDIVYYGDMVFILPKSIAKEQITSSLLQINFNGAPDLEQTWTWTILDLSTGQWHTIGDSTGVQGGEWHTLIFRIHTFERYVSPAGEIQMRMISDRKDGSTRLDYLALHMTYLPVTPTATHPTVNPPGTKSRYVFPSTFTPQPTNTATITPTATDTATPTTTSTGTATLTNDCAVHDALFECQVIHLINQERANHGIPPLTSNLLLHTAARGHSTNMAQNNFFSHTGLDGSSPGDRITAAGYVWSTWGENIAAGYSTPAQVVAGWMSSTQGHREAILNPNYTEVGIGYAYNNSSTWGHYWTTDFGRP